MDSADDSRFEQRQINESVSYRPDDRYSLHSERVWGYSLIISPKILVLFNLIIIIRIV